jgi:hypothetical protein
MDKYFDVEKHDMIYTINHIKHHRMQPEFCKLIVADLGKFIPSTNYGVSDFRHSGYYDLRNPHNGRMMPDMCISMSNMNPIPDDIKWWFLSIPDLGESESDWEMRFLEQVLKVCKDSYTRYKSYKYACDQTEDL